MSKLNLLIGLNGYEDSAASNSPSMNSFKWDRCIQGMDINEPCSKAINLQAEQSLSLFSGTQTTSADGTTTWDIGLKSGTSNTYRIAHNSGTSPQFRATRTSGADATTEITVTRNAKVLTFASTGGTPLDLIANGAIVGDEVRIGSVFNANNQGKYKIIALTPTSLSVENEIGSAEAGIVLGASFATELKIHSNSGIQVGDKVDILSNFSPVTQNTYEITDVSDDYIDIFSLDSLPAELSVSNSPSAFSIYRDAKRFLYIESSAKLQITIDGSATPQVIEPLFAGKDKQQAFFLYTGTMRSVEIKNLSQSTNSVFFVTAE